MWLLAIMIVVWLRQQHPPQSSLSPATAMRTIKPGEAIHSAHSTINPSPGTHEAFCFWNAKRSCQYVLIANHSEFHSGFDALTGEPCIISDMFPICEPEAQIFQSRCKPTTPFENATRYATFLAWQGWCCSNSRHRQTPNADQLQVRKGNPPN